MKLIFKTDCSDAHYNADCDCGVLELNLDLLSVLKARKRMLDQVAAQDENAYELHFWGNRVDFYSYQMIEECSAVAQEGWEEALDNEGWQTVPEGAVLDESDIQPTECPTTCLRRTPIEDRTDCTVEFWASSKHADLYVNTRAIELDRLVELLEGNRSS